MAVKKGSRGKRPVATASKLKSGGGNGGAKISEGSWRQGETRFRGKEGGHWPERVKIRKRLVVCENGHRQKDHAIELSPKKGRGGRALSSGRKGEKQIASKKRERTNIIKPSGSLIISSSCASKRVQNLP